MVVSERWDKAEEAKTPLNSWHVDVLLLVKVKEEQFELGGSQYGRKSRPRVMDLNVRTTGVFEMVQSNVKAMAGRRETWEAQAR